MAKTTGPSEKRLKRSYTAEQVEAGLQALAIADGNHRLASRLLAEHEQDIPAATLYHWKIDKAADYEQIKATILPQIREKMAAESEALAVAYAHMERETLERLNARIDELKPGELAQVATRIATSRGISVDKASVLRGMPTEITEHRNADELLRKLSTQLPGLIVEGTAEEIESKAPTAHPSALSTDRDQ
jgi:hypothetical protein